MRLQTALISLLIFSLSAPVRAANPGYSVGTMTVSATGTQPFPIALWYPAAANGTATAPLAGRFPMVLISHGSGGSERGHRSWAEQLARGGYVVAAPRHWGDSYDQPDGRGTDVQLIGRPLQAARTLDTVLANQFIGRTIDAKRIGMLGFSAGGYTTLVMAGARPDFSLWRAHCKEHADEDDLFCPTLVWRILPRITRTDWSLPRETRIKAAVVIAPAAILFNKAGLSAVKIPIRVYGARNDTLVRNQWNAGKVAAGLPVATQLNLVPGGHYVFLTACSPELLAEAPHLCIDPPGVDRVAIHRKIGNELLSFFGEYLKEGPNK